MTHEVPEGWVSKSFSEVVDINPKRTIARGATVPFVEMASVPTEGPAILDVAQRQMNGSGAKFRNGDTLFARITPCTENGKTGFVDFLDNDENGAGSTELIVFGPIKNLSLPEYVYHLAKSRLVRSPAIANMIGTTGRQRVPNWVFDLISIGVPPLSEQTKIAEVLSSVDEAIAATKAVIDQTKQVKKGLLQTLLTKGIGHTKFKQTPLGKIPESWTIKQLHEIAAEQKHPIVDGPFGSNLKSEHYRASGIPIIQSGFVTSGRFVAKEYLYVDQEKFEEQKRSTVRGGDIVMAKIGARSGACAIMPHTHEIGILSGNALKISTNSSVCLTEYLLHILHAYQNNGTLDKIKTTTAQPAVSLKNLKAMRIALPSIHEQRQIVEVINQQDIAIEEGERTLSSNQTLKSGLMSDLLTGRKRVEV